jgi:hypothetical protein
MKRAFRAALAAALAAAPLALAQAPLGPGNVGGGVSYGERTEVERSSPAIASREEALVPAASLGSLGTLGKQADAEAETCIIRPVMSDHQLRLCGANPAALQQSFPKKK